MSRDAWMINPAAKRSFPSCMQSFKYVSPNDIRFPVVYTLLAYTPVYYVCPHIIDSSKNV